MIYNNHMITTHLTRPCRQCGKTFSPPAASVRRNFGYFCSRECVNLYGRPDKRRPLSDRFWEKVDRSNADGCWPWMGATTVAGYGVINGGPGNGLLYAHRVAFEEQSGTIPNGHDILHHCDNPPCVRGSHLFTGTARDNMVDMTAKGRNGRLRHPERYPRGETHPNSPLTAAQVLAIRDRVARRESSQAALAREYGISQTAISAIVRRKTWRHV